MLVPRPIQSLNVDTPGPLCNTPVAIPPGQDPNVRMERHINTDCSVTTGKTAKSSAPHCAKAKCGKVLFSPIRCDVRILYLTECFATYT